MPDDSVELEVTDVTFKFSPVAGTFVPAGQSPQNGTLFTPSTNDKEDAKKRGTNVRVTVWDRALTTVEQAKTIYSRYSQHQEVVAYGLALVDVMTIKKLCKNERLRIVHDPLPVNEGPGHDGHCGFEGLNRQPNENKKAHKTLLDELAQRCFAITRL